MAYKSILTYKKLLNIRKGIAKQWCNPKDDNFSICRMGMRSGKSLMAVDLALEFGHAAVFSVTKSNSFAVTVKSIQELGGTAVAYGMSAAHVQKFRKDHKANPYSLAILDDVWWWKRGSSLPVFNKLIKIPGLKVLAIGSPSPDMEDWQYLEPKMIRLATWDVNPNLTREMLARENLGLYDYANL